MIQCPKCGGKFEHWKTKGLEEKSCPWCGLKCKEAAKQKTNELSPIQKERLTILELLKEELGEIPNSIETYMMAPSPYEQGENQ